MRCWVKDKLRRMKEPRYELGGQLPLFGVFGDQVVPRDQWTAGHYEAYCRRYEDAIARNTAVYRVLANEYAEKFGHPLDLAA